MNRLPGHLLRLGHRALNNNPVMMRTELSRCVHLGQPSWAFVPSKLRVEKGQEVKWCACGFSNKQPLCDGSHAKKGSMTPMTFKSQETKEYAFCTCKQSKNKPFCDGTHLKL